MKKWWVQIPLLELLEPSERVRSVQHLDLDLGNASKLIVGDFSSKNCHLSRFLISAARSMNACFILVKVNIWLPNFSKKCLSWIVSILEYFTQQYINLWSTNMSYIATKEMFYKSNILKCSNNIHRNMVLRLVALPLLHKVSQKDLYSVLKTNPSMILLMMW